MSIEAIMALPDNASCTLPGEEPPFPEIIELNVGGQVYITRYATVTSVPDSLLWEMFSRKNIKTLARDTKGRFFVDRDGFLFRYILDYMRDQQLVLPDHFPERSRLQREAEYFNLPELVKLLTPKISKQNSIGDDACQSDPEESSPNADTARNIASLGAIACASITQGPGSESRRAGFITIGYRGSYTLGRDSQTDAKFRRVARIMVCGKTSLAKEVFGDTLNESRDPDRPPERYTSRYYLKFTFLEQAFDKLADSGFHMVACNSTGTCAFAHDQTDDKIWTSYTEYVFYRGKLASNVSLGVREQQDQLGDMQKCLDTGTASCNDLTASSPGSQAETNTVLDIRNGFLVVTPPPPEPEDMGTLVSYDMKDSQELPPPPLPTPPPTQDASLAGPTHQPGNRKQEPSSHGTPTRPTTLRLDQPPRKVEAVEIPCQQLPSQQTPSGQSQACENRAAPKDPEAEEKKEMEEQLKKCIEDFRRIKIPPIFPDRKRHWQNDLLKKYNA
ncbi:BTB/POZ domain-containing protein KCTD12-like isoform X2 [Acipenser ruthenus]|nr:BTB/POZ domain-containing protein KCTD12-like isoform X2 [Acipenser ruthenus]